MNEEVYKSVQTREIVKYVREEYGDELEFLWEKFSSNAIWRNQRNRKWYGALLIVNGRKLGLETDKDVEIIDLRFEKGQAREFAASNENVLPGYHMNKDNWITVVLDGRMKMGKIIELLNQSYRIAEGK